MRLAIATVMAFAILLAGCSAAGEQRASEHQTLMQDTVGENATVNESATPANGATAAAPLEAQAGATQDGLPQGVSLRGRTHYALVSVFAGAEGGSLEQATDLRGRTGKSRVELLPAGSRVRKIVLRDVSLPQQLDLGLEEIQAPLDIEGKPSVDAVAIDPTRIVFGNGTLTKQAVGSRLWKCALWDFENATCDGDWQTIQILTPGQEYEIDFNATDPAYAETFDPNAIVDVDIAALDNTTIVVAFIDSGAGNHASFEIWNTNGTLLVGEVDVDATGDAGSRISVAAINATHFTIAVIDGPEDDADFYIYTRSGSQVVAQTQVDANVGVNADADMCEMGDRFGYVWADNNDNDANYELWSNAGASIFAESQVDTGINPGALAQNLVSCAAVNSSDWAYAFYDDADNDVSLAGLLSSGAIKIASTDIDTDVGETGQVAVASMRNSRLAVAFYDSTDQDITITVRSPAAASFTSVLANTDIDATAGTDSRVSVAEVEVDGTSDFTVAWYDQAANSIQAGVYSNAGAQVTAPFTVSSTPNATFPLLAVAGYRSSLSFGLCNGTFAIAYANGTTGAVFDTYYANGTHWSGWCDRTAPAIDLTHPPNATTNRTSNLIGFFFNATDASPIVNCTLRVNNTVTAGTASITPGSVANITATLPNGLYVWNVTCVDAAGNANVSQTRTLNVSVRPPTVNATNMAGPIVLNAGTTKTIACNVSVRDDDGNGTIVNASATLYHYLNASGQGDDPGEHYTNASCAPVTSFGLFRNYTCSFAVQYFALNGTWFCNATGYDADGLNGSGTPGNTTIDPLYALNVTNTTLDFGPVVAGVPSSNALENITNAGNMRINITALGYGSALGDGNAFACPQGNITAGAVRFAPNSTATYDEMENLSGAYKLLRISAQRQTQPGVLRMNSSYWKVQVPVNFSTTGVCNGTIVFQAEAP
jgi:hypothetical protein